jgi:MoxR-like ATPase
MNTAPPDPSSQRKIAALTCPACGHASSVVVGPFDHTFTCPQCLATQRLPGAQADASAAPPRDASPFQAPAQPSPSAASERVSPEEQPDRQGGQASPSLPIVADLAPDVLSVQRSLSVGTHDTLPQRIFDRMTREIGKIFVGQDELVLGSLVALFSSGHVLVESVPGLGKTLFVRTLGRVLGCPFGRIQFTADLMPSDITGAPIFDMKTQEFRFRPGPVFTQILLADEINRSPAKTHAALLEIMQEYRVTVDGKSHPLKRPFLVMATQNPIESEGTYNLPEAQLDRFMFKLVAEYPGEDEEALILKMHSSQIDINERLENEVATVTCPEEIMAITLANSGVRVADRLLDYINKLVRLTRQWPQFHMGASPRAGIALMQAVRTLAAFEGRDYAVPDDVVQLALPVLRHRVILTAEAEVEGHRVDDLLRELIRSVEVPRL